MTAKTDDTPPDVTQLPGQAQPLIPQAFYAIDGATLAAIYGYLNQQPMAQVRQGVEALERLALVTTDHVKHNAPYVSKQPSAKKHPTKKRQPRKAKR